MAGVLNDELQGFYWVFLADTKEAVSPPPPEMLSSSLSTLSEISSSIPSVSSFSSPGAVIEFFRAAVKVADAGEKFSHAAV